MKNYIFIMFCAVFLAGCATKALNYEPQELKSDYNATWQYNFKIAELDKLINLALKNNEDIATATLSLHQAMLRAGLSKADLFPTPNGSLGASGSKNIKEGGSASRSFSSSFSLSWELDIFGRIFDMYESSRFSALATSFDLSELRQSIVNSVISEYFYILYINENMLYLNQNYENMLKMHELIVSKVSLGREEPLALHQSEQNLLSLKSSLNNAKKELANSTQILKNLTRTDFIPSTKMSEITLPQADLGLLQNANDVNFSWLERLSSRPDVNRALALLNAGFYDYRVSQKDFLPRINLGGSLGANDDKRTHAYNFSMLAGNINISLPFLDFWRLSQYLKISEDEFNKLRLNYEKTLNDAVNEVVKFASFYENDAKNLANGEQIVIQREQILAIYEQKYNAGRSEFKDLLSAQNDLLNAKNTLINNKYQLVNDLIGFYKASAY